MYESTRSDSKEPSLICISIYQILLDTYCMPSIELNLEKRQRNWDLRLVNLNYFVSQNSPLLWYVSLAELSKASTPTTNIF